MNHCGATSIKVNLIDIFKTFRKDSSILALVVNVDSGRCLLQMLTAAEVIESQDFPFYEKIKIDESL